MPYRKASTVLVSTFLIYGVLVATHLGEFWPFSIYPMFSQAGNPWSGAVVRDVTDVEAPVAWGSMSLSELPGRPFALRPYGIDAIDLQDFVSKTERWDDRRLAGLRTVFRQHQAERKLLVMSVTGRLTEDDSVAIRYEPYILLTPDTTFVNPALQR